MADPVVTVEPTRVVVQPGGQAPVTVTVRNPGQIVEGYRLTVHGAAAGWAEVVATGETEAGQRDVVRAYPGKEGTATVVFTGPAASAGLAGEVPFAVLAESVVDASSSAAVEGDIEVGRVDGLTATVTPVTSRGRWSGRHAVRVTNSGNAKVVVRLVATDPDEALGFLVHPERVELSVGTTATAAVRVRSRRPFLRGQPVRLPFRVVAEPDPPADPPVAVPTVSDPRRPVLDAAFAQRPVLSRGTVAAGCLAVLAAAGAIVLAVTRDTPPTAPAARVTSAVAVPQDLQVAPAQDATQLEVRWAPMDPQPDRVLVFTIDPRTADQQPPSTVRMDPYEGGVNAGVATELQPDTRYCVQVAAVRGESQSPRSAPVCTSTAAAPPPAASGTAAPPTPGGDATTTVAPSGSTAGGGSGGGAPDGPTPGDGTAGPSGSGSPTSPTSVESTTAPRSPQPASLPPFGDRWVAGRAIPVAEGDPGASRIVERRHGELADALPRLGKEDITVFDLRKERYTGLARLRERTVLVAVGPFPTKAEADAACGVLGIPDGSCAVIQPGNPS